MGCFRPISAFRRRLLFKLKPLCFICGFDFRTHRKPGWLDMQVLACHQRRKSVPLPFSLSCVPESMNTESANPHVWKASGCAAGFADFDAFPTLNYGN
jgi:hypothetical protein